MHAIPLGAKGSFTLVVAPEHLANRFKDAMLPPVLATPIMVLVMENAALNAIKGEATLTPEQAKQFEAGDWYINVHTKDHPAGEIRGQVKPPKS